MKRIEIPIGPLKKGDKGSEVEKLQTALQLFNKSFIKSVDGVFGERTDDAVRELQKLQKQTITGVYDYSLAQILYKLLEIENESAIRREEDYIELVYSGGGPKPSEINSQKHLKHTLSHLRNDKELIKQGFENVGLIGHVLKKAQEHASLPIFLPSREWRNGLNKTEIPASTEEELVKDLVAIGYSAEEIESENDLVRVHSFTSKKGDDKLICSYPLFDEIEKQRYTEEDSSPKYLFFENNVPGSTPIYVYSTNSSIKLFETFEPKDYKHDAEIIPDGIAKKDLLNRKDLMEVIHKKVKTYWNDKQRNDSFTLLINGPWGSGKSSMLFYLREFLTKNDNWHVVDYNAWKNQRFDNPWWILVNKVSKEVPRTNSDKARSHWYWKNISQNAISYRVAFVLALLLIIGFANNWLGQPETLSFIGSVIALVGSAWLAVQGVIKQLFKKQAMHQAESEHANDPLQIYKDRFEEVVKGKKVAIFIDDLDRCEVEPTIKLLEGIQTLFKDSKVLYVMAADGQWLVNCFDKKYSDFERITSDGQTIGNQFLQKTFQLIVDVPKINKEQISSLLNTYVGDSSNYEATTEEEKALPLFDIMDVKMAKSAQEIRGMTGSTNISSEVKQAASERLEELIEEDSKKLEHYILEFQKSNDLPLNPRQLKRIINLYTMKSQEFAISGVTNDITQEMILKYVIFSTEYPKYKNQLNQIKPDQFAKEKPEIMNLFKPLTPSQIKEYF